MKVSDLITKIIATANDHFEVDNSHVNDCVRLSINVGPFDLKYDFMWEVHLYRPTQAQLDRGMVDNEDSIRLMDCEVRFRTTGQTLIETLSALYDKIENEYIW